MFLTPFRISSGTSSGGGGTGMVNGATNVGSGSDIFKQLVGDILEFRGILGDAFITNSVVGDNVVLTFNQSALSIFQGDVGAGGVKGLVPPPAAGDAAAGKFLKADGVWSIPPAGGGGGTGTVTSVGLSAPGTVFTVAGSPINNSGTLALGFVAQNANTFLAGGTTGGASAPNFRTLVTADYPNSSVTYAKIQNIANGSRLLGSSSAGGGPVQEITLGAGLNMSGTTLNTVASGGGDVSGGAFSVDNEIAIYSGGTGKLIKQSGVFIPASNEIGPTGGGRALMVANPSTGSNKVALVGSNASAPVQIMGNGPGPNVGINYVAQLDSNHVFYTNNPGSVGATGTKQFAILNNSGAVNSLETQGGSAGIAPILRATGTDTNIDLNLVTKGTGVLLVNGVPLSTGGGSGDVTGPSSSIDRALAIYNGTTGKLLKTSTNDFPSIYNFSTGAGGAELFFIKSKSATIGTSALLANGDNIGTISFLGGDGTGYPYAAQIVAVARGTPALNKIPADLIFTTTPLAGGGPKLSATIDSEGRFILGAGASIDAYPGQVADMQIHGSSFSRAATHWGVWNASGSLGPINQFTYSRNSTVGSHGIVQSNDILGFINFLGSDGTKFAASAQFRSAVDGATSADTVPGRVELHLAGPTIAAGPEERYIFRYNDLVLRGGQIAFPIAQNPSVNPNTLDDYEEGTWTPYITFTGNAVGTAYSTQAGKYTKVGNAVTVTLVMALTSKGSSVGSAYIFGLPFVSSGFAGVALVCGTVGAPISALMGLVIGSGSQINLSYLASGNRVAVSDTTITNTSDFYGGGTYLT